MQVYVRKFGRYRPHQGKKKGAVLGISKAQVLLSRDDTNGVGMTHTTTPPLYTDYFITFAQDVQLDGRLNAPLETVVDILLPVLLVKIRLTLWEKEGIDSAV